MTVPGGPVNGGGPVWTTVGRSEAGGYLNSLVISAGKRRTSLKKSRAKATILPTRQHKIHAFFSTKKSSFGRLLLSTGSQIHEVCVHDGLKRRCLLSDDSFWRSVPLPPRAQSAPKPILYKIFTLLRLLKPSSIF